MGSIADTFVIFLELSILIDIWSIWIKSETQTLVAIWSRHLNLNDIWSIWSRTHKHSLPFEVGLWGL